MAYGFQYIPKSNEAEVVTVDPRIDSLLNAMQRAREDSRNGYMQHVNLNAATDRYFVSDWHAAEGTIISYYNGKADYSATSHDLDVANALDVLDYDQDAFPVGSIERINIERDAERRGIRR